MSETVVALLTDWGIAVAKALAVLIIGFIVAGMTRGGIRKAMQRANADPTLVPFVSSLVYYVVVAVVIVAVLRFFGVEVASIIAIMGAAAFAVGLALQGTLSHFAAGVMLLVFRPFKVGDVVDVGGTLGVVESIQIFSTIMNTPDNVKVVVPNSNIWGQTIKNFAANATRRNDMIVGVSYADDLNRARAVITKALDDDPRVLEEPAYKVAVSEMGDSSVNFVVRPWCKKEDYWDLRFDLTKKLKEDLEAAGCSIPFPQRDVHLFQESA